MDLAMPAHDFAWTRARTQSPTRTNPHALMHGSCHGFPFVGPSSPLLTHVQNGWHSERDDLQHSPTFKDQKH
eukprot:5992344-Amphidinium_carterae.1